MGKYQGQSESASRCQHMKTRQHAAATGGRDATRYEDDPHLRIVELSDSSEHTYQDR